MRLSYENHILRDLLGLLFLLVASAVFSLHLQAQEVILGEWRLHQVIKDNDSISQPYEDFVAEISFIQIFLANQEDEDGIFEAAIYYPECWSIYFLTMMDVEETTFNVDSYNHVFDNCPPDTEQSYLENLHNSFYFEEEEIKGPFTYMVTEEVEEDNVMQLHITNVYGDEVHYNKKALSTPSHEQLSFQFYFDALDSKLHIRFAMLPQTAKLKMYDMKGQLLKEISVQDMETSINMYEYTSGVYFINLIDGTGKQEIKRFIKR